MDENTWALIEHALDRIFSSSSPSEVLSRREFTRLYTLIYTSIYTFSTVKVPLLPPNPFDRSLSRLDRWRPKLKAAASSRVPPNPRGADLYYKLVFYHKDRAERLKNATNILKGRDFLRFYVHEWKKHEASATYIDWLFAVLNRHWVSHEMQAGAPGVYRVSTLAMLKWKEAFFPIDDNAEVFRGLIEVATSDHPTEEDVGDVKALVKSISTLGDLDLNWESSLRSAARVHYTETCSDLIREEGIDAFVQRATMFLKKEEERLRVFTGTPIPALMLFEFQNAIISPKSEAIQSAYQKLGHAERTEDVRQMFDSLQEAGVRNN